MGDLLRSRERIGREVIGGQELAVSRNRDLLAVLHGPSVIFLDPIRLVETGRAHCETDLGGRPSFSPDGKWLAFRRRDSTGDLARTKVVIVDVVRRRVFKEIETDNGHWGPVFFAREELLLTVGWFTQETRIWDTSDWHLIKTLEGTQAEGDVVALSDDGETFAMSGHDGQIHLWDLSRLESKPCISPNAGSIWSLAFDLDGKTLAVATISGPIQLWNVAARHQVASLTGHRSYVVHLEFSPDGRYLASRGFDRFIRLWSSAHA